jgi:Arc/MetJ-type ribon-helix-helix transcriptional regulator
MTTKITLQIPKELKQKLEERIKQTNFKSIQDYLLFILEQMTSEAGTERKAYTKEEEAGIKGDDWAGKLNNKREGYSEEEESDLKQMLEDKGYL